jgi:prepilin-type N-terminal cleavage/methylation domain-containing protein
MNLKRRARKGFTLMEVAVAAVLIAVLAAATIPTLSEFMSGREATTVATQLSQIAAGVATFKTSVLTTGNSASNTYPRFISQLTNVITSSGAAASSRNSCYNQHTNTAVTNWAATGPFVTFNIPVGGLHTPLGVIQDSMFRSPNSANVGTLAIRMTVDSVDAIRLDRIIDGGDGAGAGTLRITAFNGTGSQTRTADLQYLVPVAAKC